MEQVFIGRMPFLLPNQCTEENWALAATGKIVNSYLVDISTES